MAIFYFVTSLRINFIEGMACDSMVRQACGRPVTFQILGCHRIVLDMAGLLQACRVQVNKSGKTFLDRTGINFGSIATIVAIRYCAAYDVTDGSISRIPIVHNSYTC